MRSAPPAAEVKPFSNTAVHTAPPTREPLTGTLPRSIDSRGTRRSRRVSSSLTETESVRLLLDQEDALAPSQRSHLPGAGSHRSQVLSGRGGRFFPSISCTYSLRRAPYQPATHLFCLDVTICFLPCSAIPGPHSRDSRPFCLRLEITNIL